MKKLSFVLAVFVFVLSLGAGSPALAAAEGKTLYVNGQTGSDSNDGSANQPFATIQKACDVVNPGDTVLIAPGVYYGTINLTRCGTAEQPIVFRAQESGLHAVTLTGADKNIREKRTKWKLEDAALGLYSVPFDHDPARMTCDDMDLQAYNTLEGLKHFELVGEKDATYLRGAKNGFVYVEADKKLYVRLRPDDKWGSKDPNDHLMAVPTSPVYDSIVYNGAERSGYKGNIIGDDSYIFGVVTEDAPAHVVLDGFTYETPGFTAVYVRGSHVTVRNSWFRGCRAGVSGGSRYIDDVFVSEHVTVESCDFTEYPVYEDAVELIEESYADADVRRNSFFWWQRKGMESGDSLPTNKDYETGGFVNRMGNYWILRNNDLSECFDTMPWSSFATYMTKDPDGRTREHHGGIGENEIYRNRFYRAVDNAIEFENNAYNVKVYENEFIDNYMGISWQPMQGREWPTNITIYKNVFYNSEEHGKMWMEKAGYSGSFVKIGAKKDQWGWWPWMADEPWDTQKNIPYGPVTPQDRGMLFFNNTVYNPYTLFLEKTNGDNQMKLRNFNYYNNIFVTHVRPHLSNIKMDVTEGGALADDLGFTFSHNLFAPSVDNMWARPADVIADGGFALHGPSAIGFRDIAAMDVTLTEDSPARGKGILLEDQPESSTDLGAVPYGETYQSPSVGPRPYGDVNLDGCVDAADLAFLQMQLALDEHMERDSFCDLDFNGRVDQRDYDLLYALLAE